MFHPCYYKLKIVQSEKDLKELVECLKKTKHIFFDTETSGLRVRYPGNDYIVGFTFAVDDSVDKRVFYIPVKHEFEGEYELGRIDFAKLKLKPEDFPDFKEEILVGEYYNMDLDVVVEALKPVLTNEKIYIAHNICFDWHVLQNCGFDVRKMTEGFTYDDTMTMHHTVYEEEEKKLENIIRNRYGIHKTDYDDAVATVANEEKKSVGLKANQKASFPLVQIPIAAYYSGEDVFFMKDMYFDLIKELKEDEQYQIYCDVRKPFHIVLWQMERHGVRLDQDKCREMIKIAEKALEEIKYEIYELTGIEFNVDSGQQVAEILFGHKKKLKDKATGAFKESYNEKLIKHSFNFPVVNWTDGGKSGEKELKAPKTDAKSLEEILKKDYKKDKRKREAQKVVELLLKYSRLEKLYGTYMVGMLNEMYQDGKIHPSFNLTGTETGRLSCSNPNLQNLTRPLEKPKEPKKEDYPEILDYEKALKKYKEEKAEYDFWIRFEIRSMFIPDDETYYIAAFD
jgi:DNA polymerase I-like protein with 3'-5' exonuclease and polymerase domains